MNIRIIRIKGFKMTYADLVKLRYTFHTKVIGERSFASFANSARNLLQKINKLVD